MYSLTWDLGIPNYVEGAAWHDKHHHEQQQLLTQQQPAFTAASDASTQMAVLPSNTTPEPQAASWARPRDSMDTAAGNAVAETAAWQEKEAEEEEPSMLVDAAAHAKQGGGVFLALQPANTRLLTQLAEPGQAAAPGNVASLSCGTVTGGSTSSACNAAAEGMMDDMEEGGSYMDLLQMPEAAPGLEEVLSEQPPAAGGAGVAAKEAGVEGLPQEQQQQDVPLAPAGLPGGAAAIAMPPLPQPAQQQQVVGQHPAAAGVGLVEMQAVSLGVAAQAAAQYLAEQQQLALQYQQQQLALQYQQQLLALQYQQQQAALQHQQQQAAGQYQAQQQQQQAAGQHQAQQPAGQLDYLSKKLTPGELVARGPRNMPRGTLTRYACCVPKCGNQAFCLSQSYLCWGCYQVTSCTRGNGVVDLAQPGQATEEWATFHTSSRLFKPKELAPQELLELQQRGWVRCFPQPWLM